MLVFAVPLEFFYPFNEIHSFPLCQWKRERGTPPKNLQSDSCLNISQLIFIRLKFLLLHSLWRLSDRFSIFTLPPTFEGGGEPLETLKFDSSLNVGQLV